MSEQVDAEMPPAPQTEGTDSPTPAPKGRGRRKRTAESELQANTIIKVNSDVDSGRRVTRAASRGSLTTQSPTPKKKSKKSVTANVVSMDESDEIAKKKAKDSPKKVEAAEEVDIITSQENQSEDDVSKGKLSQDKVSQDKLSQDNLSQDTLSQENIDNDAPEPEVSKPEQSSQDEKASVASDSDISPIKSQASCDDKESENCSNDTVKLAIDSTMSALNSSIGSVVTPSPPVHQTQKEEVTSTSAEPQPAPAAAPAPAADVGSQPANAPENGINTDSDNGTAD